MNMLNIQQTIMRHQLIPIAFAALSAMTACSQDKTGERATVQSTQTKVTDLDPAAFQQAVGKGTALLVDVRTPAEFAQGHLSGAINVDWTAPDHEKAFAELPTDKPLLLYCQAGGRSGKALAFVTAKGYSAQHLVGGYGAWQAAGLPTSK